MKTPETCQLLFGPYSPPLIPKSGLLRCEMRGLLRIGAYSQAPIPWPMRHGKHSIILCGDLVRAVKTESVEAVSYHWNVSRGLVQVWRKTLGVSEFNAGTKRLRAEVEKLRRPFRHSRHIERWNHPEAKLPLLHPTNRAVPPLPLSSKPSLRARAATPTQI